MRSILLAATVSLAMTGAALAGQCPADMAAIDAKLAQNPDLTAEQLAQVTDLRKRGEEQHASGQHAESVETLAEAKKILGIE